MKSSRPAQSADIDWHEIHARLAQAAAGARQALAPSPERAAILLDERARRLAQPLAAPRGTGAMLDLVVFRLCGERYAIETRHVQEVCRFAGLTPVPGVPEVVAGVANLRGQIFVVFDIRLLFGLKPQEPTETSRIVVCGDAQPDLGLLVDSASEVARLPANALHKDTAPNGVAADTLIQGIARDATIIIDGAALLTDQRLFVDQPHRQ